jgi:hypothetical protein
MLPTAWDPIPKVKQATLVTNDVSIFRALGSNIVISLVCTRGFCCPLLLYTWKQYPPVPWKIVEFYGCQGLVACQLPQIMKYKMDDLPSVLWEGFLSVILQFSLSSSNF